MIMINIVYPESQRELMRSLLFTISYKGLKHKIIQIIKRDFYSPIPPPIVNGFKLHYSDYDCSSCNITSFINWAIYVIGFDFSVAYSSAF
jgi:hypothetical protein